MFFCLFVCKATTYLQPVKLKKGLDIQSPWHIELLHTVCVYACWNLSQSEYTHINILVSSRAFSNVSCIVFVVSFYFNRIEKCEWSLSSYVCLYLFYQMGWIAFKPGCQLFDAWKNLFIDCSKECIYKYQCVIFLYFIRSFNDCFFTWCFSFIHGAFLFIKPAAFKDW